MLKQILNGKDDDGSGWVKVSNDQGGKGLVPASYVEYLEEIANAPPTATHSRTSQGSGQYGSYNIICRIFIFVHAVILVRGLYDYQSQGSDELGISEGEIVELSGGLNGGQNYADGWWEGKLGFS